MNEGDATWSLGILVGIPFTIILFLLFVGIGVWLLIHRASVGEYDKGIVLGLGITSFVCAFVTVALALVLYYPYNSEYHQYVTKVGKVKSISSRVLGSSDSFQQKFVVQYEDGRAFGCTDTRCALVKKGDYLKLGCKRIWQYNGTDGYDCNWIGFARVT